LPSRRTLYSLEYALVLTEQRLRYFKEDPSLSSQLNTARSSEEKACANFVFDEADALAERRLLHAELLRGPRDVTFLGYGHKVSEVPDFQYHITSDIAFDNNISYLIRVCGSRVSVSSEPAFGFTIHAAARVGQPREWSMVAPTKFAHVVLNTPRFDEMIDWYARVFEARVQHRDNRLAFLTYDDEHHRFAFVNLGPAKGDGDERPAMQPGLNHLGYTWRNLNELMDTYARLKSAGIMPSRAVRHGPTLSLYYDDPDRNGLEFQVDLLNAEDANKFMRGPAFAANPIGEPFDPDALATRLAQHKPVNDLIFRSDQVESNAAPVIHET
jgi:catechol 2,3-dioxygenase-like lactoylglutathione lyase family enzyme